MLIDSGGGGEDVGKLTRKRLNRGLPGRKQGTVRIQVADFCPLALPRLLNSRAQNARRKVTIFYPIPLLRPLSHHTALTRSQATLYIA